MSIVSHHQLLTLERTAAPVLDLAILDTPDPSSALVLAHARGDFATAALPMVELRPLVAFRDQMHQAVLGLEPHPAAELCAAFGHRLFGFLVRGEVAGLYARLPSGHVRIQILVTHPELAALPWELLCEPGTLAGPSRQRSIARIVPAQGHAAPRPAPLPGAIRVLFVAASPADQFPVDSESVRRALEYAFRLQLPTDVSITVINGASRKALRQALARQQFDILHFSGHGDVSADGVGRLVFVDTRSRGTDFVEAPELARLLGGLALRLVVLSACETACGSFRDDFAVTAAALVRSGIPAVVANQMPVPNATIAPFTGGLYRALLRDGDIDKAVVEGRLQLAEDLNSFEWAIPVLYRHYEVTHLFEGDRYE